MTDAHDKPAARATAEEPFLERWSRRKVQAREGIDEESPGPEAPADPPADAPAVAPPAAAELPDLDTLGEDSDYSAFMAPGVDASVRRKALRKLFASPKFNVRDGMDDYCDDFTRWTPLGEIVTADMRYQIERAARLAERLGQLEEPETGESPATGTAGPAAAAVTGAEPAGKPADDPEREA